ncbi:hypothetical protein LPJ66_004285 [Kickxella alabastrina]|uniref:Uncharacterized protein n=1 Tax=Kickxella alabastrina TaxID=61397 RepID=A0ACC1ILH8_9FUNG|nr:hypothetical protein LPJ66_004285 [Kickxella alabastrina]
MNASQPTNTKRKADAASEQAPSGKRAKRSADNAVNTAPPQNNVNRIFTENTASREIKTQPAPTTPSDMGSTANEDSPASNEQAGAASVPRSGNTCIDAKVSTLERRTIFERMEPAMRELKRHLSGPHPGVIELAVPLTVGYKQRAATVAEAIHRAMEWHGSGSNHTPAGDLAILEELINTDSVRAARLTRSTHAAIAYLASKLRQDHNVFSKWTRTHTSGDGESDSSSDSNSSDSDSSSGSSASKGAGSFISFVTCLIQGLHQHAKGEHGRPEPRRVLIPPAAAGVEPEHTQVNGPIDMVIEPAPITIAIAAADSSEATLDDSSNPVEDDDDVYVNK